MADSGSTGPARGKKGASDVYLIVDARERAVIPFIETELQEHAYVQKQINTGDYLICRKTRGGEPKILACIERKTHEDFAASFKDGRYENIKKMRALRAATGCQLYFFIEGAAFPSPNRRFARIPFSSILAAITKLMVRDGVFVVQTEDQSHSAKRLADFLRVFDAETPYAAPPDAGDIAAADPDAAEGGAPDAELAVPDVLTAQIEQTDDEAAVVMWARLRGISVVLGKILTREFTAAELATQKVAPDRIRALKTATGRPINKDAVASLLAVRAGSAEHAVKLVSGLRNITPAVATLILESAGGLSRLCAQPTVFLAGVKLPQKTRTVQLGKTRAERIRRILHYKVGAALPAEDPGHSLADLPGPPPEPDPDEYPDSRADTGCEEADGVPVLPDSDVEAILSAAGFE
jgi:ERCC4-type nuclease